MEVPEETEIQAFLSKRLEEVVKNPLTKYANETIVEMCPDGEYLADTCERCLEEAKGDLKKLSTRLDRELTQCKKNYDSNDSCFLDVYGMLSEEKCNQRIDKLHKAFEKDVLTIHERFYVLDDELMSKQFGA